MLHRDLSLIKKTTHSLLLTDTMTKQLLISQLRLGNNGQQLLEILDALTDGMDSSESSQDSVPTLDEISF